MIESLLFKNMVVLGKKIVKIILYFLKTKKVFRAPKKAKILVIDGERLEILKPLFNGEAFEVFYTRKENINISPSIIIRCVLYILRNKKFRFSLSMSFIQQVKPSIVLTFIDNSSSFHQLDANNKDDRIKFIAIQNGNRKLKGPIELVKKSCPDPKTIFVQTLKPFLAKNRAFFRFFPFFRFQDWKSILSFQNGLYTTIKPLYIYSYYFQSLEVRKYMVEKGSYNSSSDKRVASNKLYKRTNPFCPICYMQLSHSGATT